MGWGSVVTHRSPELQASLGGLTAGRAIGPYELLAPIAMGGMAFVWAAKERESARVVAIKTLLPSLSADPRFEKMFLTEGKIAMRVRHPNVCDVIAAGEDRGLYYLVMDWVDGDSLAAIAGEMGARIPPLIAARIVMDVARGLHAAHECVGNDGVGLGIVHRDVSPQNILVGIDGSAKIADFGIAKATRGTAPNTLPGYAKGKIRYMAPEQVYCEDVDRRTDVFALGVVLYEAITGVYPFDAVEDVAILAKLAASDPARSPRELAPEISSSLAAALSKAIEKAPEDRYATMEDFAAALSQCEIATTAEVATFVSAAPGNRALARRKAIENALAGETPERDSATPRQRRSMRTIALFGAAGCVALAALWAASVAREAPHAAPLGPVESAAPPVSIAPAMTTTPASLSPEPLPAAHPAPHPETIVSPTIARRAPAPRASSSSPTVVTDVLGTRE